MARQMTREGMIEEMKKYSIMERIVDEWMDD